MSAGHHWRRRIHVSTVIFFGLLMAAPFYWMIINSFKSSREVVAYPPTWWPTEWHFENVFAALTFLDSTAIVNSVIFTAVITITQLTLVVMTGFALAKMQFFGRGAILGLFIMTLFVPGQVATIPTFILVRNLNWIDTFMGLCIPIIAQTSFGVFIFRQFYISMPNEILDAAKIDGANWGQIFLRIVLPLSGPPIAAYTAVTVLTAWNMYAWPLISTTEKDMRVLPLALAGLGQSFSQTPPNIAMMAVLLSTLPIIIFFILCQRYFINGLGGSLKE
ncbi:MAG: carbohydrate ABC transporter permease [Devosia sp.]|nr:carbohydrate ABC transporter permease [Devosia sp.]